MVSQVPIVAILIMINGVVLSIAGLAALAFTVFLGIMANIDPPRSSNDKLAATIMITVCAVAVLLLVPVGLMQIIAGIRCRRFRGRTLALVSLFAGALVLPTIYCAPTTLAIGIYGLVVLFNGEVKEAFGMGSEGIPREEILDRFRPRRPNFDPYYRRG